MHRPTSSRQPLMSASEATEIIATAPGDPSLADHTWVIRTEAAEGGCAADCNLLARSGVQVT